MHRVWAVARNTMSQAIRIRAAVAFVLIVAILLPLMSVFMVGDGTLLGRLQTFVSYGLGLTSLMLSLFTLVVAAYTLTSEFDQQQIFMAVTKPLRRYELLLGKLLGVLILDAILLAVFAGTIFAVTMSMPKLVETSLFDKHKVETQFFTARHGIKPVVDEAAIRKEVNETYASLVRRDPTILERPERAIKDELTKQKEMEKRAVPPAGRIVWTFQNVRPRTQDERLFIRFKMLTSDQATEEEIVSQWWVGDFLAESKGLRASTPTYVENRKDSVRTAHEISIPADAVKPDGELTVGFLSSPNNRATVIFPTKDGMEVLYRRGSFEANFLRATAIICARLIFLAALGISAATWMSLPVVMLTGIAVLLVASMRGFAEAGGFGQTPGLMQLSNMLLLLIMPDFGRYNPGEYIVKGRLISWDFVGLAFLSLVVIKGLALMLLGTLVFSRREIARVTV